MKSLKTIFTALIVCAIFQFSGYAQIDEIQKFALSDRAELDRFGWAMDIDGDFALISAVEKDFEESNGTILESLGAVYAFRKDSNGNWIETQKIIPSDTETSRFFGWSISMSGSTAVVGAFFNSTDANGANPIIAAGAAYILQRDANGLWAETQKIVASDRSESARFGNSVSIDANQLIVGAFQDKFDATGNNELLSAGAAYLFTRNSNGVWTETQKIVASARDQFIEFGTTVAIDANSVVVGVPREKNTNGFTVGGAYFFEKNSSGTWLETAKVVSNEEEGFDRFGYRVSIDDGTALIGAIGEDADASGANPLNNAGAAYIYKRDGGGTWSRMQKLVPMDRDFGNYFGASLQLSGKNAIISGTSELGGGGNRSNEFAVSNNAAYIFTEDANGVWVERDKFQASDQEEGDYFGRSVAIDSGNIMVGAIDESEDPSGGNTINNSGSVYVFQSANLGLVDNELGITLIAFPNPTNGSFTIALGNSFLEITTRITNILGQVIASQKFENVTTFKLDIEGNSGIYFVTLTTAEGVSETIKIVKE